MNKETFIENFDPKTFNLLKGTESSTRKALKTLLAYKCIPEPHLTFTESQVADSIEYIMLRDPLLGILCALCYKYALQPYQQVGLLKGEDIDNLTLRVRPHYTDCFETIYLKITINELLQLAPYIATTKTSDQIFRTYPEGTIWDNIDYRWEGLKSQMVKLGILSDDHSLFSYYTTAFTSRWKAEEFLSKLTEPSGIKQFLIYKYSLISTGRVPSIVIDYSPPNPFGNNNGE